MGRKPKENKRSKKTIAIFCEGESEVHYFRMLQRKYNAGNVSAHRIGLKIKSLGGKKGTDLVDAVKSDLDYDKKIDAEQVYLVFDRDDLTKEQIQQSQSAAREYGYTIIFSSINFEIWILLHFESFTRSYTKKELYDILSNGQHFDQDYRGFKGDDYDEYLLDKVATAMENAENLKINESAMASSDPFTNVQCYVAPIFGRAD